MSLENLYKDTSEEGRKIMAKYAKELGIEKRKEAVIKDDKGRKYHPALRTGSGCMFSYWQ